MTEPDPKIYVDRRRYQYRSACGLGAPKKNMYPNPKKIVEPRCTHRSNNKRDVDEER